VFKLLVVILFVVFFLVIRQISVIIEIFVVLFFVFFNVLVFLFFEVVGNGLERYGMRLRHFEFCLALRTAQDFALFDFVFIDINFNGTFWATEHDPSSDMILSGIARVRTPATRYSYYIRRWPSQWNTYLGSVPLHRARR
jgi:hypothetical protein